MTPFALIKLGLQIVLRILDIKLRRESFDLANTVADRESVVEAKADAAIARGDVDAATRLREQYRALAGTASTSLIPAAQPPAGQGSANPNPAGGVHPAGQ